MIADIIFTIAVGRSVVSAANSVLVEINIQASLLTVLRRDVDKSLYLFYAQVYSVPSAAQSTTKMQATVCLVQSFVVTSMKPNL